MLNDPGQASACYGEALALKPDYAEALNNLGLVAQDARRLEEAREHSLRASGFLPDLAEARNNLARVLKDTGQIEEAIGHYR